jgi:hypothetical protein
MSEAMIRPVGAAFVAARKECVLPVQGDGADRAFEYIGVDLDATIAAGALGRRHGEAMLRMDAAFELAPLHDRLVSILKASAKLFANETRCPVLEPTPR